MSDLYLPTVWIKISLFTGHLLQLYVRSLIGRKAEDKVTFTQLEAQVNAVTFFGM